MFSQNDISEIRNYLAHTKGRIYIGCDSVINRRFNLKTQSYEKWARFAVVLVVHINNSQGCKIFSYAESERVFDTKMNKPTQRLMTEAYKSVDCFMALSHILENREVEIHLDLNSDEQHASNAIAKQAIGYVKGMTNLEAAIKPNAWAGSSSADHVARKKADGFTNKPNIQAR